MKRNYRHFLGAVCLGIVIVNSVYWLSYPEPYPIQGVVNFVSWFMMWVFVATSGSKIRSEKEKFLGAFGTGCFSILLIEIILGNVHLSDDVVFVIGVFSMIIAMILGLWWSEVSPVE